MFLFVLLDGSQEWGIRARLFGPAEVIFAVPPFSPLRSDEDSTSGDKRKADFARRLPRKPVQIESNHSPFVLHFQPAGPSVEPRKIPATGRGVRGHLPLKVLDGREAAYVALASRPGLLIDRDRC